MFLHALVISFIAVISVFCNIVSIPAGYDHDKIYFAAWDYYSYISFFPYVLEKNSSEHTEMGIGFQQLYSLDDTSTVKPLGMYPYSDRWDISPDCSLLAYDLYNENLIKRQEEGYDGPISMIGIRSLITGEYIERIAIDGEETYTARYSFSPDGELLLVVVQSRQSRGHLVTLWRINEFGNGSPVSELLFSTQGWIEEIRWKSADEFVVYEADPISERDDVYLRYNISLHTQSITTQSEFYSLQADNIPDFGLEGYSNERAIAC